MTNELSGPIDPATGLPCPICNDGTPVRHDTTGRDDMLPELLAWSDARPRDATLVREETIARAAGITMLARAGAIDVARAKTIRETLLAAFDASAQTQGSIKPPPALAMPDDAYASLALRLRVRIEAASAFGELTNFANELAMRAGIEHKAVVVRADGAIAASYLMSTWATSALRAGEMLWDAARRADALPIGVTLPAEHRAVAAEILGLGAFCESALDVDGDVDFALDYVWAGARVMTALARLGADAWALLASGATLHAEAEPARSFFREIGTRAGAASARARALVDAARASPFGRSPDDVRAAAAETGATVIASIRAMRVALYHVVLDPKAREPSAGPSAERIAEELGALRASTFGCSERVANVRPLALMRRAIDAEELA
jgi:hypothetical protein